MNSDTVSIDLKGITTKADLHALLKRELHFPDWYGPSWDALFDRLVAQPGIPTEIRLLNWQDFAQAVPREMATLRLVIDDYAREQLGRRLVLG